MLSLIQEWLHLLVRWAHVIAGIMWIGDSFLFMWLDSHLSQPTKPREGTVVGELWMTHSGGFYEVVKRKSLQPNELPPTLYWFKWESYSTWITGFLLLVIVYWFQGASYLVDSSVLALTQGQAVAASLGLLVGAVVFYDLLARTKLVENLRVFGLLGLALITAAAYGLTHVFSGRGAFLHVGAMLGTIMASNVFFRIIPAQRAMIAATEQGKPVDTSLGLRAKVRSTHNHFLTLPVLFTMLSNHFPSTYGNAAPWAVLACLVAFGVGIKLFMNKRLTTPGWALAGTLLAFGGVVALTLPKSSEAAAQGPASTVSDVRAQLIVFQRCTPCHAQKPTHASVTAAPKGLAYESLAQLKQYAPQMAAQVKSKAMPLANLTQMTDEERAELLGWLEAQGATP